MDRPVVRDAALLVLRVALGAVFIAHGWRSLFHFGPTAVKQRWVSLHIPYPDVFFWVVVVASLAGGVLLIVGLLSTIVAGCMIPILCGAVWFVHGVNGFFVSSDGYEYVMILIAALVIVVVFGPGRVSLDSALTQQQ